MAKTAKNIEKTTSPVVYCGPTIPGVAKHNTVYTNGVPAQLTDAQKRIPALKGLVIPLDQLPEARKQLSDGNGRIFRLYQLVQAKL